MTRATITTEQSQAIAASGGSPVYLVDETGKDTVAVIVPLELLNTLTRAATAELDINELYAAQEQTLAAVWHDPRLDEYTLDDGSPID